MEIKKVMNRPFITDKDNSLSEAAKIMSSKNIGSLIFYVNNKVKGIITDSDLIRNFDSKAKISSVMAKDIVSISPEESIDKALKVMRKNEVKRLLVLESSKLTGIITLTDIMAHAEDLEDDFFFED